MASVKGVNIVADTSVPGANIRLLYGSKTHDWASLAAGVDDSTTITVTGAALGDLVIGPALNATGGHAAGVIVSACVTAADTVTVSRVNETVGAIDSASGVLSVLVVKLNA